MRMLYSVYVIMTEYCTQQKQSSMIGWSDVRHTEVLNEQNIQLEKIL